MAEKIKVPFGIIENDKIIELFSKEPKKAARQYNSSEISSGIPLQDMEKIFPYKKYDEWLNEFGIALAQVKLESEKGGEDDLIIIARTYEEMTHFSKVLKNRQDLLKNYDSFDPISSNVEKLKDKLEKKIRKQVERLAPNTSFLLGPILAARLIAKANGLEKLAKMPVSKIQIIGAEKSLFRYLKEKAEGKEAKNPKYGMIYLSPYILNAKSNRGKVARALASKIMITSRIDFFSKDDRSEQIKQDFLKEYEKITNS